eukprot:765976-Hanusia_phi.AAC.8
MLTLMTVTKCHVYGCEDDENEIDEVVVVMTRTCTLTQQSSIHPDTHRSVDRVTRGRVRGQPVSLSSPSSSPSSSPFIYVSVSLSLPQPHPMSLSLKFLCFLVFLLLLFIVQLALLPLSLLLPIAHTLLSCQLMSIPLELGNLTSIEQLRLEDNPGGCFLNLSLLTLMQEISFPRDSQPREWTR